MGRRIGCWGLFSVVLVGCGASGGGGADGDSTSPSSSSESTSEGESTIGMADTTVAGDTSTTGPNTGDACDGASDGFDLEESGEGGTSGGSAEDTNAGMGGDIPIGATVFTVRMGGIDAGTLVEIEDLVVTAPVVSTDSGSLVFVQAIIGGEYSGITLDSSSPITDVEIGSQIRVVGRVARLDAFAKIVVDGDVEEVVVEGVAEVPAPIVIELAALTDPSVDLVPYESALIRIDTPEVVDGDLCPGEFALTADLRVDDLFLGKLAPTPATGSSFTAILGPLRYTSDGFEIAPRTLDDLIP